MRAASKGGSEKRTLEFFLAVCEMQIVCKLAAKIIPNV
jgi:hypothetical protein